MNRPASSPAPAPSLKAAIMLRIRVAYLLLGLVSLGIVGKILLVQWVEGKKWMAIAERNGLQFMKVKATRGDIVSDNGSLLATSLPFFRIAIDPTIASDTLFESNVDSLAFLLARHFGDMSADQYAYDLRQARMEGKRYKALGNELVKYQHKKLMEKWPLFAAGRLAGGVIFEKVDQRFLPFDNLARRTIGFVREDTSGIVGRGIEISYQQALAGKDGEALFQRMAGGKWKPLNDGSHVRPEGGLDVQTTLDIDIQDYATRALESALYRTGADYGACILMEVQTGEIKAMVNLGKNERGEYTENNNYAVGASGVTEPGSTFKLASMMALLEETNVTLDDTVNTGDGNYKYYEDCIMTDATKGGYGNISVQTVFEKSSNIGVSKLIFKHFRQKPEKFIEYLDKFGMTKETGFQMAGEGRPFIRKPGEKGWSGCSLPWLSIGYEGRVSPLQTLTLYNAVANGGKMIRPIVVKRIMRGTKIVKEFEAETITRSVCSDKTLRTVQSLLEGVVERGTAKGIKTDMYRIAGKTGTTQKIKFGKYTQSYYTSFVGYFPAEAPRYTCIVVIDDPSGADMYGGVVAAPVFRQIADRVYIKNIVNDLDNMPVLVENPRAPMIKNGFKDDIKMLCEEFKIRYEMKAQEEWVASQVKGDTAVLTNNPVRQGLVPNVVGMTLRDAVYLLENSGMQVRAYGAGRVRKQSIRPGSRARRGGMVFISLG